MTVITGLVLFGSVYLVAGSWLMIVVVWRWGECMVGWGNVSAVGRLVTWCLILILSINHIIVMNDIICSLVSLIIISIFIKRNFYASSRLNTPSINQIIVLVDNFFLCSNRVPWVKIIYAWTWDWELYNLSLDTMTWSEDVLLLRGSWSKGCLINAWFFCWKAVLRRSVQFPGKTVNHVGGLLSFIRNTRLMALDWKIVLFYKLCLIRILMTKPDIRTLLPLWMITCVWSCISLIRVNRLILPPPFFVQILIVSIISNNFPCQPINELNLLPVFIQTTPSIVAIIINRKCLINPLIVTLFYILPIYQFTCQAIGKMRLLCWLDLWMCGAVDW